MRHFFHGLKKLIHRLRAKQKHSHAIHFLNGAQFFGAANDNLFKFLCVFLLIHLQGVAQSNRILFWVGTVYIMPFLLFSAWAGTIADRVSKQRFILGLKVSEIVITVLGVIAFAFKQGFYCYILLFLLAAQSALFGPPKYSIIPEIVPHKEISKANGLITSFTYLSIIIGSFLATFVTDISHNNYALTALVTVFFALVGWVIALFIPHTAAQHSTKKSHPLFVREIYRTLVSCRQVPKLLLSIFGSSFFLYIGGFFQLNIIPFAIETLHMTELGGGYLFFTVAVGIAIGALIAGRLSKHHVELGLSALGGVGLSLFLFLLVLFPRPMAVLQINLVLLGVSGGFFVIPFEAFIQANAPPESLGQVVAAANFMSFCGVLLASFSIYVFGVIFGLDAGQGMLIVSAICILVTMVVTYKVSFFILRILGTLCLSRQIPLLAPDLNEPTLFLFPHYTWKKVFRFATHFPDLSVIMLREKLQWYDRLALFFPAVLPVASEKALGDKLRHLHREKWILVLLKQEDTEIQEHLTKLFPRKVVVLDAT